ncbi:MAG: hypothetical protein H6719_38050, partial [Sandaracinaceae bacterium]|nr:hypothetical protein [Sandaracinaceae bacterium]
MTDAALAVLAPQRTPLFVESVQRPQANALPRVVEMVRARTLYGCAYGVPGFDHPRDRAFYTRAAPGEDGWREDMVLVQGLTRSDALELAALHGQRSVFEIEDDELRVLETRTGTVRRTR